MIKVTLRNSFHNTAVNVIVPDVPCQLTPAQASRVSKVLCGNADCQCGIVRGTARTRAAIHDEVGKWPISCWPGWTREGIATWDIGDCS